MKELLKSSTHCWHREKNDSLISVSEQCVCREVYLKIPLGSGSSRLSGTRFLFFSDTHSSPIPFRVIPGNRDMRGTEWIMEALADAIRRFQPHYLLFGGDLNARLCSLPASLKGLAELKGTQNRLAVPGNWEMMREYTSVRWKNLFRQAGFRFLQNEEFLADGIRFYGMDDYRFGVPLYRAPEKKMPFQCVMVHNPDAVPFAMDSSAFDETDLILCGHTHGGQIRLPGFGALMTSSVHWKRFEYGLYVHENGKTRMFVSAGMGVTWFQERMFCPPELLMLELS